MIKNNISVEILLSLLFFGTGVGFTGFALALINEGRIDESSEWLVVLSLTLLGIGGIMGGFGLSMEKGNLTKAASLSYFFATISLLGVILEELSSITRDRFVLVALVFILLEFMWLAIALLGNERIFPWLKKDRNV